MPDYFYLLFGVGIILFYSYDRFNVTIFEGDDRLERLVTLLSPDKLRARGTVLKAYSAYATMLVLIYLFFCAYGELIPLLGGPNLGANLMLGANQLPASSISEIARTATGFAPISEGAAEAWAQRLSDSNEPTTHPNNNLGIAPSVSLGTALILVGLAPTFPILKRFDEWMRSVAHSLAGIPTWIVEASDQLRGKPLRVSDENGKPIDGNTLLISQPDWDRLQRFRARVPRHSIGGNDDFWNDLDLILAASTWFSGRKLKLAKYTMQQRFEQIEKNLLERKEDLIQKLDGLTAWRSEGNGNAKELTSEETETEIWERLEKGTRELADDFRILIALFVEHGIIEFPLHGSKLRSEADSDAEERNTHAKDYQEVLAKAKLQTYASVVHEEPDSTPGRFYATPTWLWTLGVIVFVSIIWSIVPGNYETALQRASSEVDATSVYWRAMSYIFTAFNVYGLTLLVALVVRDGLKKSAFGWLSPRSSSHWTRWLPQTVLVLLTSWIAAVSFMVSVALWQSALQLGWPALKSRGIAENVIRSLEYNAPIAMRGAILALMVLLLLDIHRALGAHRLPWKLSLKWAAQVAVVMAIVGSLTRYLTYFAGSTVAAGGRREFDEIDTGLMIYAGLHSALIGFFVIFCVSEMMSYRRSRANSAQDSTRSDFRS